MALPQGFNPNSMSFGNISRATPVFDIPRNTAPSSSFGSWRPRRRSLWSRFNEGVADIGNWFAEKAEDALGWVSVIMVLGIIVACAIKILLTWIDGGFWMALLMAIGLCIGGCIAFGIGSVIITVAVNVIMYGMRILFWNAWTLLLAIVAAVGLWGYAAFNHTSSSAPAVEAEEVYVPTYPQYRVTANVLNLRIHPNASSDVLGVLHKGDVVTVVDKENGFAAIEIDGHRYFASLDYLTQINE